jgi:hypothetical protein
MEIDAGPVGFVLVVVLVIIARVVAFHRSPKPVFDRKRRELRYGREAPIPFRELEVRVFRYRQEEDPDNMSGIGGSLWGGLAAGTEEIHRVYVRAGGRRVDLSEFRSAEDAERYADEIRAMIAEA